MDENEKIIVANINLLLEKIYSLRQVIDLQEEMDKYKEEIRPYYLVFSRL